MGRVMRGALSILAAMAILAISVDASTPVVAAETTGSIVGSQTRLQLPRFVSLKSDKVNARGGPTKDHQVVWIYQRQHLPVEVTAEFENWRRIRDQDGVESWVFHSMLAGRRTAMVQPRGRSTELIPLMDRAGGNRIVARLEPRVLGHVRACDRTWCRITGEGFDGWIEQTRLWGVYPNEPIN